MTQELNRLWKALHNPSDGKFAAHEIRESACEALAAWGVDVYKWIYDLIPFEPKDKNAPDLLVPPEARTRLKNITAGLLSGCYSPQNTPCPLSDLDDIAKLGEMINIE
ncbi:MAG: hypothetical protein PBV00_07080 [Pseudomonas asiatica]